MQVTALIRGDANSVYARLSDGSYLRFNGTEGFLSQYDVHTTTGTSSGTTDGVIDLSALMANLDETEIHHFVDTTGGGFELVKLSDGHMAVVRDNGEVFQFFEYGLNNYDNPGPEASDGIIDIEQMSQNTGSISITRWTDSSGQGFELSQGTEDTHFITRANGEFLIVRANYLFNGGYDDFSLNSNTGGVNDGVIDIEFLFQNAGSDGVFRFTPLCIASGALIKTLDGEKKIEDLQPDDKVLTLDKGYMPIRWKGTHSFTCKELQGNEKLRSVRISAGALGDGLPERDLIVSRQHRVLFRTKIAERMFGVSEVLVAAINLTELPGIYVENDCEAVCYHHLLFDTHAVIFADGAPVESLFTGKEAMKSVSPEARAEILEIFPDIMGAAATVQNARYIPSRKRQKRLVERHLRNDKSPLEAGAPQTLH